MTGAHPTPTPLGVVLDLGNVLIDWQPALAVAAGVGAVEAQRFLEADDFDFLAWNHLQDAGRPWAEGLAEVRRTHPHWAAHAAAYVEHFAASLGEVPGTTEIVRELRRAQVPTCGLTNWSDELYYPHAVPRFEVLRLLDHVVVSGEVKVAKPDPRAYAIAAERLGLPLHRLVFVDDRRLNVDAAVALGMDGVVFTDAPALRRDLSSRGLLPPAAT